MTRDKIDLIVKACSMYYFENMNQEAIAKKLGVSRPQISRFLTYARNNNIVTIRINDPHSNKNYLEERLCRIFNLPACVITDLLVSDRHEIMRSMGEESNGLLKRIIKDDDIVGVSAGKTLYHVSLCLQDPMKENIRVIPVCGGTGYKGEKWQTNKIISNIEERWNCRSYQLNSPTFVSSASLCKQLTEEYEIKNILNLAKQSNVIIAGIGILDDEGTLMQTGFLMEKDIQELIEKKAISSICNSFLDENGHEIDFSGYERMIGYKINDFSEETKIITYAFGEEKIKSIVAALRTGRIYALVTDITTAETIVERYG